MGPFVIGVPFWVARDSVFMRSFPSDFVAVETHKNAPFFLSSNFFCWERIGCLKRFCKTWHHPQMQVATQTKLSKKSEQVRNTPIEAGKMQSQWVSPAYPGRIDLIEVTTSRMGSTCDRHNLLSVISICGPFISRGLICSASACLVHLGITLKFTQKNWIHGQSPLFYGLGTKGIF